MAEISNTNESWNGHSFPEVETFIKGELNTSGKKVAVETSGNRFRVNLLDDNNNILSQSAYVSTSQSNVLKFSYTSAVLNIKLGDKVYTEFYYQVTDANGVDALVPAQVTVTIKFGTTIKGTISKSVTSDSTTKLDITDYIEQGETSIEAKVVTDNSEFTQTIYGRINAINLVLSSRFDPKQRFSIGNNLSIPYSLVATTGTKVVEWFVDKSATATGTYSTTSNSASATISIPTSQLTSGTHTVQIRAKYNNGGTYIYSNSICFFVTLANDNVTTTQTGFGCRFDYDDGLIFGPDDSIYISAGLYSLFTLDYYIYDSTTTSTANLYLGNDIVSTGSVNSSLQYSTKLTTVGDSTMYAFSGNTLVYQFTLKVISAGVQIEEPANPAVLLRALNKSNSRSDKDQWTYNNVNYATFNNFNWTSDGWLTDSLLIRGNASLTLNIKPFQSPTDYTPDQAMTIIFKIKVATVLDLNQAIISCMSSGYGISITPQLASMMTSTSNTVSRLFASGQEYEIGFVSYPADGGDNDKMVYLYINGIVTSGIRRSDATVETIYQSSPSNITINGQYADVYLYSVSYYRRALSANEMVDLYLLNINDTTTFIDEYENNNVIDDGGSVTVSSIPDNIPYIILTGQSSDSQGTASTVQVAMRGSTSKPLPRYDIDEILFVNKQKPAKNFKIVNGCIRLQGTTTLIYPIKNLRIYSKNSKKEKALLYLGCDASGEGGTLSSTHKYSFKDGSETASGYPAAPVSCFVLKADCSDSSSTHNVGFATFINKVFIDSGVKTPALKKQSQNSYDIRVAIDGFPCYVFYRETTDENPIFLGKFNMINDKGSGEVFGFEDIKGLNNKSDGYRNVGDFKLIRVNPTTAYNSTSLQHALGSWETLRQYAIDEFTTTYSNGTLFNNGISTFDDNGDFIEYNDLGEHVYYDRYGFVYDDDSWAVFYDCTKDPTTGNAVWTLDDEVDGETCHKHINPTECWEFATNLSNITNQDGTTSTVVDNSVSSRVLFTTSEFTNKVNGVAEWTNDFDLRYPDSDDLLAEYQDGTKTPKYLKAVCDWLSGIGDLRTQLNAAVKAATFKNELANYFNVNNIIAYFCATQLAMGVDQMAKNMMLCFFYDEEATTHATMGKMRGYLQFYDNDTILGLRNDGYLVYNWDLDFDTWDSAQNQYAYAGYQSVLWGNLVYCYQSEIKAMYQTLRENFTMQDILDTFTKQVADKYCERIVNIDMYNKYIQPLMDEGKNYLMSLHGTRTSHRTWLLNNRVDLFDAKYFAGDYNNTKMMLRGGRTETDNTGNISIVSQRDWYYAVEHESTISEIKFVQANGTYTFTNRLTVSQSLSPLLFGLKYAKSLDLSDFIWNISSSKFDGTYDYLQELIYSKYTDDHTFTSQGEYCNIGSHAPILKRFVACHLTNWGTLDVSDNNFIEEIDVRGSTGVTSIAFPSGDSLTTLRLGSGLTTLTLLNKPNIITATIEGAANFNGDIKATGISNAAASMILSLLNYRYNATSRYALGDFVLEMGTATNPVTIGQTNVQDLIKLAQDTTVRSKTVTGYCQVTTETIYRYQYNLLSTAFPNLTITCTPSPDVYQIGSLNSSINECQSTSIYTTGMNIAMLNFELGKLTNNVFSTELDTPTYSGSVHIDETYPLSERITITSAGVLACSAPHENAAWTLDVYIHAYPYYYTTAEKVADTYANSPDHYVKITINAVPVTGITISLALYLSPNTIYKPTYTVSPSNNTKSTQGVSTWSSNDVTIDSSTGQFTSPTQGTIAIVLTYSMFGKTDGDSVKQTSANAILNSAILSKTENSSVFYKFRDGLINAIAANKFSAFEVYNSDLEDSTTGLLIHKETQQFTATELLDITADAFTYILTELSTLSGSYSFSFGAYLTGIGDLKISDSTLKFGSGLTDIVLPITSLQYTCATANLFSECRSVVSILLPELLSISLKASGAVTNLVFKYCGTLALNGISTLSLPKLASISMESTTAAGITNEMFYNVNITSISLPVLSFILCNNDSDNLTDHMFGGCLNLASVSMPNLTSYTVGAGGTLEMFKDSSNITTLSIGNVGANNNSVLSLNGFSTMTKYLFSDMLNLRTFNTKIIQLIPGIAFFSGDTYLGIDSGYTLDWSNTKLNIITQGADKFFYKCERLRKWILPSTIAQCPITTTDSAFLFGSNIQVIDIRNRVDGTTWGDLFKGSVNTNTDSSITTPVKLLFLHFNPNTMPTFSNQGTGLSGNYPVFIGNSSNTTLFDNWKANSSSGSFASIYDASSYNALYVNYLHYKEAIDNGMEESQAYNIYPCTWERSVTANRLFPYCMAKWMSRKIFMTSLSDSNSGLAWSTINNAINTELGTTNIEYDLDDITGTILNQYNFDTQYVDSAIITSYGTPQLARAMLDSGLLASQFPNYTITYNESTSKFSITNNSNNTSLTSFEITRSLLTSSSIYNNASVRSLLNQFRAVNSDGTPKYGNVPFNELQYFTSVTAINAGTSADLSGNKMAITQLTLPAGCTSIGEYGLCNTALTLLSNAYSITSLGSYALASNTSLTEIYILSISDLSTSQNTFNGSGITKLEFGALTSIHSSTFSGLSSLTTFINAATLSTLDTTWFTGLNIQNYTFANLVAIPADAFKNNTTLKSFSAANATSIGASAFEGCTNLETINLSSIVTLSASALKNVGSTHVDSDSNVVALNLTLNSDLLLIKSNALEGVKLTALSLPEVTLVETEAFKAATIPSIKLPKAVNLGSKIVYNINGLTKFEAGNFTNKLSIASDTFDKISNNCVIIIYAELNAASSGLGTYQNGTLIKPIIVADQYEDRWESLLASYYDTDLTSPYNVDVDNVIVGITDSSTQSTGVTTESIESRLYTDPYKGTDVIYTYYTPYNTSLRTLDFTINNTSTYYTYKLIDNKYVLIIPTTASTGSQTDTITVTETNSGETNTLTFTVPEFYIVFEDDNVKQAMLTAFDTVTVDNKLTRAEINAITTI